MSLAACMSRWPITTRWPWLRYRLLGRNRSRTDAWASFIWRNSGSAVATHQESDPGAGADAAHAHDLVGHLDQTVLAEQVPAVGGREAA